MLNLKIEVFTFTRDAVEKTLYSVSTEIDDGVRFDSVEVVRVLRLLYPKSTGVRISYL